MTPASGKARLRVTGTEALSRTEPPASPRARHFRRRARGERRTHIGRSTRVAAKRRRALGDRIRAERVGARREVRGARARAGRFSVLPSPHPREPPGALLPRDDSAARRARRVRSGPSRGTPTRGARSRARSRGILPRDRADAPGSRREASKGGSGVVAFSLRRGTNKTPRGRETAVPRAAFEALFPRAARGARRGLSARARREDAPDAPRTRAPRPRTRVARVLDPLADADPRPAPRPHPSSSSRLLRLLDRQARRFSVPRGSFLFRSERPRARAPLPGRVFVTRGGRRAR